MADSNDACLRQKGSERWSSLCDAAQVILPPGLYTDATAALCMRRETDGLMTTNSWIVGMQQLVQAGLIAMSHSLSPKG